MPSATVTFLFTDIEGSTQLWERHQQGMQAPLARHDALLDQAIGAHAGHVVKRTGDGCHAAFTAALDGALAALAAQHALAAEPWADIQPDRLRVRMALHTGEAEARDGDYYGPALNRAARLMAAGHGGQVLLSQVTAGLLTDQLPPAATLLDLGEHRLKDLTRPEHIFQLGAPGLPADFPPLRSLDPSINNLPVQLSHFIGREREMADLRELLMPGSATPLPPSLDLAYARSGRGAGGVRSALEGRGAGGVRPELRANPPAEGVRLLTLTGSGGTGKTRLSLQLAADLLPQFPDGAWLVELAPVTDPALVVQTIAATLGVRQQPQRPLFDVLVDFLRGKRLLLILDNCEHLIAACADAAERLLRQCSHLTLIASSREALGIDGETTYPVPSLSLPPAPQPGARPLAAVLAESEAARLFADRATAALPSFALTGDNAASVSLICRRLDGIPLAIELAAARVRLLRVDQIASRLDDRFRLLTGGSRTALPRQQTLRALIDWSYALLSEPERAFLQMLSVFAGGWTLEAAETVCNKAPNGTTTAVAFDTFDLLSQLVNKSLIVFERDTGDEPRYRLLETIRQYARDKLFDAGVPAHWRDRHLRYFLNYAVAAQPGLNSPRLVTWLNRFDHEHDNFRAAMEWALETDPLAAMQLAEALGFYLARRGFTSEGIGWLNESAVRGKAAAPSEGEPGLARGYQVALARVLGARALFDFGLTSSGAEARAAAQESVDLSRQLGDRLTLARSLGVLGMTTVFWGDAAAARPAGEEALALAREQKDSLGLILALGALSVADDASTLDREGARQRLQESLRAAREMGNPWTIAMATLNLARRAAETDQMDETRARYDEAIRLFIELGDATQINGARSDLAHALRRHGRLDEAVAIYHDTLRGWQHLGHRGAVAHQLESLAVVALARRQPARAARLLGAAEVLREASGSVRMAMERAEYDQTLADLRAQLPAPDLESAWAAGRAMPMDEGIEFALSGDPKA